MLKPWKPRGPQDKAPTAVDLIVFATQDDRDKVILSYLMTYRAEHEGWSLAKIEDDLKDSSTVKLPGGYAIVHAGPRNLSRTFTQNGILKWARLFNTESGMPYAWRSWTKSLNRGTQDSNDAGRSPCMRGQNLRDVIRRTLPDFMEGRFKEKGVDYGEVG